MGTDLVLYQPLVELTRKQAPVPTIIRAAGQAAMEAAEDFFDAGISNGHTRKAYRHAVNCFLVWAHARPLRMTDIAPRHIGQYMKVLVAHNRKIATRKQHLAALRHFFDAMVMAHVIDSNPALSVRGERYEVVEGKTPEITVEQARRLLASIDTARIVGLRDRAIFGILIYTAVRVGAAVSLRLGDLYDAGDQWILHFDEKGGRSREIPVRHDLQRMLFAYLDGAGLRHAPPDAPMFLSANKKRQLSGRPLHVNDVCRMMKRRLRKLRLPDVLSPHSFRVTTITNLLEQDIPLEDVQRLAGHADPRTTRLYDRRHRKITRNIVERISI